MMLKITVEREGAFVTFHFDGRLAGPEARELVRNWHATPFKQPHQKVVLDVAGLTAVDAVGLEFLAQAHCNSDALADGATDTAIVDAVAKAGIQHGSGSETGAGSDDLSGRTDRVLSP
jgi:anti-anti-sigma regulatory factor